MSFTIGEGRIFEGTFLQLKETALEMRKRCQARVAEFYWERAALMTAKGLADKFNLLGDKHLSPLIKHSVRDMYSEAQTLLDDDMYRSEKSDKRADGELDLTYTISAIPLKRSLQNILIVPFVSNRRIYKDLHIGRYYGFWDNADPDEEASEEEWESRARDWKSAYAGSHTHAEAGFSFEVMNHMTIRMSLIFMGEGKVAINKERRRRTTLVKEALSRLNVTLAELELKLGKPLYEALYEDPA